jgi:hypothetical protein
MAVPMPAPRRDGPEKASVPGARVWPARETPASTTTEFHGMKGGESAAGCRAETQPSTASSAVDRHVAAWRFGGRRCARRQTSRTKPFRSGRMQHMAIRLHKLVVPWLLICPPVWAARLPVPPVPPSVPPPASVAKVPNHSTKAISTKAVWSRKTPIPPIPPHATTQLAKPAPVPDQDAQPPPDPNSTPHTKVSVANFRRQPTADSGAGFPYGSQFQSREEARPIQTPGLTVTIPLRLP